MSLSNRATAISLAVALLTTTTQAAAFDPFEIQVYDGAANEPGVASLELHTNYNHAPHRAVEPPEMSWHKQAHFTLEPALGITPWWELGAYLQMAARFGDGVYWAGAKIRSKFVTPEGMLHNMRLGLNIELSAIPKLFEADRFGGELRPIWSYEGRYIHTAVNPNIEFGLTPAALREGPSLSPAVMFYVKVPDIISLGVEYYGAIGPIAGPLAVRDQEHYLFGVANVLAAAGWEINVGVGAGLTPASNTLIAKVILGHDIGRLWGKEEPRPAHARLSPARL